MRPYLGFTIGDQVYRFRSLPMGAKASPFFMTKMVGVAIRRLRSMGLKIVSYVDDFLIIGDDEKETVQHLKLFLLEMARFGWKINWQKSVLRPSSVIDFLGFSIVLPATDEFTRIVVPNSKRHAVSHELRRLSRCTPTARVAARVLGRALSLSPAVTAAPVLLRSLSIQVQSTAVRHGWNASLALREDTRADLLRLADEINAARPRLLAPPPSIKVATDASLHGSGAVLQSMDGRILKTTQGSWQGASQHINVLELLAAERALRCFASDLHNKVVKMEVDNTVALSYLRRFTGRIASLRRIARRIFDLCKKHNIHLLPQYLSSGENIYADHLSRTSNLKPSVAVAMGLSGSVSFPIPKTKFITSAMTIAKHTGGALLTPDWESAAWWPILAREAGRKHLVPVAATTLDPRSNLARAGRLVVWDFSRQPLSGYWRNPNESSSQRR